MHTTAVQKQTTNYRTSAARNTKHRTNTRNAKPLVAVLGALAFALTSACANAAETLAKPVLAKTLGVNSSVHEGYAAPVEQWIEGADTLRRNSLKTRHHDDPEIWVADLSTLLYSDTDDDGYFAGFSLSIDVDVQWDTADVYAELYLQRSGAEPSFLHSTNVFTIYDRALTTLPIEI